MDAVDVSGYGLVRLKADNIYLTPNSYFVPGGTTPPSIQLGINAASAGDTVNVEAAYNVSAGLTIGTQLTLAGAERGNCLERHALAESVLNGPSNQTQGIFTINTDSPVTIDGFTINGSKVIAGQPNSGDLLLLDNILNLEAMASSNQTNMIFGYGENLTLTGNQFITTGFNPSNTQWSRWPALTPAAPARPIWSASPGTPSQASGTLARPIPAVVKAPCN